MGRLVQGFAHAGDVRGHTGRGFVVADQDGFDLVLGIGLEDVFVLLQGYAGAPFAFHDLHFQAQALAHVNPEVAELSKARGQYFVARR